MSSRAVIRDEVLRQLDQSAGAFNFLMLDNGYDYPAAARLSAYSDGNRWAIVIEGLGYHNRCNFHEAIQDVLYLFGNVLSNPPGTSNEGILYPTSDPLDGPLFDEEYGWTVREGMTHIRIRDHLIPIQLDPDSMRALGVELQFPPAVGGHELLRSLVPQHRDRLLATEEDLHERVPTSLPLVLRLDEWHHPDLAGGEIPSKNETFCMVADVIASADHSHYRPTCGPNTHWSNWPDGGSL